jgi:flagellar basal-body rod modification protein FlgD
MQVQSLDPSSSLTTPLPTSATTAANANAAATAAAVASTDDLGNESTFLQLLVAQIQNQDPTQPMDSSTFLTQLAEFSSVEQLIGIRQDVAELDPSTTSTTSTTPTTSSTSGS